MRSPKSILKVVLPLLLGIALVWYSLSKISLTTLTNYARNAEFQWILLGILFGILSHASRAYRWLYMVEPLGYKPRFVNSFMAVYSAYLINFTIPRAGELARASILTNYEGIPFNKGIGTIVAERVADTVMLMLIILTALLLEFDFIYTFFSERFNPVTLVAMGSTLLLLAYIGFKILKQSKSSLSLKIKRFMRGLLEGLLSIFKMKRKWVFICHTVFIWGMYVLMFYVTTFAISDLNTISFAAVLIGFIMASFSIAATNGGIGSFPEVVVIAFLLFNLPEDPSRAFGWIMWASQTLTIIILGGISLLYLPIYNRKRV